MPAIGRLLASIYRSRRQSSWALLVSCAAGLAPSSALAVTNQTTDATGVGSASTVSDQSRSPPSAPETGEVLQQVTVTAQKRTQNVQRVPIDISTFSGPELAEKGILNSQDLPRVTPGLLVGSNVILAQPYIRGVGSSTLSIGAEPSVATYVDGVYITRPAAVYQTFFDVGDVEVLKGPQGTLYGRNATGGVINIVSQAPTDTVTGRGEITYGDYDTLREAATLSGPMGDSSVRGRVTVLNASHAGYSSDPVLGIRLDDENIMAGRGALEFNPSKDVLVSIAADFSRERDTRGENYKSYIAGAGAAGYPPPADPWVDPINYRPRSYVDQSGAHATVDWNTGIGTFTSITAYRRSSFDVAVDLDASPADYAYVDPEFEDDHTFTEELRLATPETGRIKSVVGIYYLSENATESLNVVLVPFGIDDLPSGATRTRAYAGFGELTFQLTDALQVTAGGRYSDELKHVRLSTNFPPPTVIDEHSGRWSSFTPKLSLQYMAAREAMLYLSATRGFKSGGFDALTRGAGEFNPEYVWAYEAGAKTRFLGDRVQLNGAAFYYKYNNLQVNTLQPGGIVSSIRNAAAARIYGGEVSLDAIPADGLTLQLGLSVLDAKYTNFNTVNPLGNPSVVVNLAGNTIPFAPKEQLTGSADYKWSVAPNYSMNVKLNGSYTSRVYFDFANDPRLTQGGYLIGDAQVGIERDGGPWRIYAYARNIGNKVYAISRVASPGFYGYAAFWGDPRTFGVTAAVHF